MQSELITYAKGNTSYTKYKKQMCTAWNRKSTFMRTNYFLIVPQNFKIAMLKCVDTGYIFFVAEKIRVFGRKGCVRAMEQEARLFCMEASGSLTPDLEGVSASLRHTIRMTNEKKEKSLSGSKQSNQKSGSQTHTGRE